MNQRATDIRPLPDYELERDILARLHNEPSLSDAEISVEVANGKASLRGSVPRYGGIACARAIASSVKGVSAVRSELTVEIPAPMRRSDADICDAALAALRWNACLRPGTVNAAVHDGRVTLRGRVDWSYQKTLAEQVIAPLAGITSICNRLTVGDRQIEMEISTRIRAALRLAAEAQADAIHVKVQGGKVTLRGVVPDMRTRSRICAAARGHPEAREICDELREKEEPSITDAAPPISHRSTSRPA